MMTKTLQIEKIYKERIKRLESIVANPASIDAYIDGALARFGGPEEAVREMHHQMQTASMLSLHVGNAKPIIFPKEQVEIFFRSEFPEGSIYRLPFDSCFIQFSDAISARSFGYEDFAEDTGVIGFWLMQKEVSDEYALRAERMVREDSELLGPLSRYLDQKSPAPGQTVNSLVLIYEDFDSYRFNWEGKIATEEDGEGAASDYANFWKKVCTLVSVYINCKNIDLHQGKEKSTVAKRCRKAYGVNPPPYYKCVIKNKKLGSRTETGTGTKHGHRYDVMGHFRTLNNGETIWISAHQRGLDNEKYIPKTYIAK